MVEGRTHIEFKQLGAEALRRFSSQIQASVGRLQRVQWVEVNPYTHRVVIAFDRNAYTLERLMRAVEDAEQEATLAALEASAWAEDYPADAEPADQLKLALGADVAALLLGAALRVSPMGPSAIAGNAAAFLRRPDL